MKITTVRYERVYNLGSYESERIGVEVSLDDEDPQEALALARATVKQNHEAAQQQPLKPDLPFYPEPQAAPAEDDFDRMVPPMEAQPPPNGNMVTEKQLKAIYAIGRAVKRWDEDQVNDRCAEVFGVRPSELTKAEASQFIDLLKGEAAA